MLTFWGIEEHGFPVILVLGVHDAERATWGPSLMLSCLSWWWWLVAMYHIVWCTKDIYYVEIALREKES